MRRPLNESICQPEVPVPRPVVSLGARFRLDGHEAAILFLGVRTSVVVGVAGGRHKEVLGLRQGRVGGKEVLVDEGGHDATEDWTTPVDLVQRNGDLIIIKYG